MQVNLTDFEMRLVRQGLTELALAATPAPNSTDPMNALKCILVDTVNDLNERLEKAAEQEQSKAKGNTFRTPEPV